MGAYLSGAYGWTNYEIMTVIHSETYANGNRHKMKNDSFMSTTVEPLKTDSLGTDQSVRHREMSVLERF